MVRLHIALCLLSLLGFTSPTHAQETIWGRVRLKDNRLIFQYPSTPVADSGYVVVSCPQPRGGNGTPTTKAIQPLTTALSGDILTIVKITNCKYFNGEYFSSYYVEVKTAQGVIGYTQLPNYHTLVEPANEQGAFARLLLNTTQCDDDPECNINYATPFAEFAYRYPHSSENTYAAAFFAGLHFRIATEVLRILATSPESRPDLSARYAQYSRDTLLTKANQVAALADEMEKLKDKYQPPRPANRFDDLIVALVVALPFVLIVAFFVKQWNKRDRLTKIDGVESLDDVEFRLHELRRFQNSRGINFFRKSHKSEDAIFRLKQREERMRRGDTPPDTIIGYKRE